MVATAWAASRAAARSMSSRLASGSRIWTETVAARDDGRSIGLHDKSTECPDGAVTGEAREGLVQGGRVGDEALHGIAPERHGRCPRMVRLALEAYLERADADNRVDDAENFSGPVQDRTLLDMQLDEGSETVRGNVSHLGDLARAMSQVPESNPFGVASGVDLEEGRAAAPKLAARQAAEPTLLVLEGNDGDTWAAPVARSAGELKSRGHAERAVEPAAERLCIRVRSHEDRWSVPRWQAEEVSRRIDARLEAGLPHPLRKPAARRDVGIREGRSGHTGPHATDGAEMVKRGQHARGVCGDYRGTHRLPFGMWGIRPVDWAFEPLRHCEGHEEQGAVDLATWTASRVRAATRKARRTRPP